MKKIIILLSIIGASNSAFSAEETSTGYLVQTRGGVAYQGISSENSDTGFLLSYEKVLREDQIDLMYDCMEKKHNHAIEVIRTSERRPVPSGIPGRNTFFNTTTKIDVSCIKVPTSFLQLWRDFFRSN